MRISISLLLAALSTVQVCLAQGDWRGPLPVRNERPLQAAFGGFAPQNPDVLARGETRISAQIDIANNLLLPNASANGASVREDFETQRLTLAYARGWKENWQWGAKTSLIARNGGVLDGAIEMYHRALGLKGNGPDNPLGRDNLPRGQTVFEFRDGAGKGINVGRALGLGDTQVWLGRQLSRGRLSSGARMGLKLPTGSSGKVLGSGGLDAGAIIDARYQFSRDWALFGHAGANFWGNSNIPDARNGGMQGGLGLEWKRGQRTSILAQIDAASRTVSTGNTFADRTPVIASVGIKRDVGRGQYFASFSENGDYHNYNAPLFGNIGPDFTLSFGYSLRR